MDKRENISFLTRKFVNHLMVDGKKKKAEAIFENIMLFLKDKNQQENPLSLFLRALYCLKPSVEVRSVRRGGATYQIPVPLKEKRALSIAMKWIIQSTRKKKGSFLLNLVGVLFDSSNNQGECIKKKEAIHILALKNRSLTHFRWF